MTLSELCEVLGVTLQVQYYDDRREFVAWFSRAEVKKGDMLLSTRGSGKTREAAIADYVEQIKGQTLVMNALASSRREVKIPASLEVGATDGPDEKDA